MIFLICYTLLLAFLEIQRDGYAILNHTYSSRQNLTHRYAWCARALAVVVPTFLLLGVSLRAGITALALGALFWVVFDTGLNLKRKKHPFYVGYNASTDKQIRDIAQILAVKPETLNMYLKAGILTIAITWFALSLF
ncbi:hypothetical protein FVR03_01410 [Pontibacter qinzhouensis]|uniref:Uncharacterized protein n=1 Tax=Pontibacter qinzhouensis TaxID=2603253 RepID=A0A5C8KF05_9BACT|nr:hypothetical protein [Pontibacter qinzhouensis]TXK52402.1 hypothetical protein FVR03_01410 [Pontibacter qinzhouensis]